MAREDARTVFSKAEIDQIEALVKQLERAPADKQKGIRGKIRRIGLYWSEVAGGAAYTVQNLRQLVSQGVIKVHGAASRAPSIVRTVPKTDAPVILNNNNQATGRANSDEFYVIDLCDEVLGLEGERQYRFPFLVGDSGRGLPVDVYYRELNLVVEYYERQHTEEVKFFNRRMTVSGVSRGEQRKIYDERRRIEFPKHGIKLVIISYSNFGQTKKLVRNHDADLNTVKAILKKSGVIQ